MSDDDSEDEKLQRILEFINERAALKDWENLDTLLFSDEMLTSENRFAAICSSRFYDKWLTKRQPFIEKVLAQDLESEDEEKFPGALREWVEDSRYYEHEDGSPMFWFPFTTPAGFLANPELLEELKNETG